MKSLQSFWKNPAIHSAVFVTGLCLSAITIQAVPVSRVSKRIATISCRHESDEAKAAAKFETADALYDYIHRLATSEDPPPDVDASDRDRLIAALAMREYRVERLRPAMNIFLKRYPHDPRRWDVQLIRIGMPSLLDKKTNVSPEEATRIRKAIVAALDASANARHEARADLLQTMMQGADPKEGLTPALETEMIDYAKDYPDDPVGGQIVEAQLRLLQGTGADQINGALEKLVRSPNKSIADTARARLMLQTKPLDWKFTSVNDGQEIDLSRLRGKVVLLDFWATWCVPCMATMPEVIGINKKYQGNGFQSIGVSLDEDQKKMLSTAKAKEMDWPEYCDGKGWKSEICTRLGVSAIPCRWLVDKKGFAHLLEAKDDLDAAVVKLLDE